MARTFQLREIKKAKNKLLLLDKAIELMKQKSFRNIYVDEICKSAELSQATFFNFFRQKEDLLMYFIEIWQIQRNVELFQNPKQGIEGIRYLFDNIVNEGEEKRGVMLSLISFISDLNEEPQPSFVSDVEKSLLFPDVEFVYDLKIRNLYELFSQFVVEGQERNELVLKLSVHEMVKVLFTIFYGAFLTGTMFTPGETEQWGDNFREHYESHLKLLVVE